MGLGFFTPYSINWIYWRNETQKVVNVTFKKKHCGPGSTSSFSAKTVVVQNCPLGFISLVVLEVQVQMSVFLVFVVVTFEGHFSLLWPVVLLAEIERLRMMWFVIAVWFYLVTLEVRGDFLHGWYKRRILIFSNVQLTACDFP